MKFNTHYSRKPPQREINSGEIFVEKAGYLPTERLVNDMIRAGQRLADYRLGQYDLKPEDKDDFTEDITRSGDFDMSDASQITLQLEEKKKQAQVYEAKLKKKQALEKETETVEKPE